MMMTLSQLIRFELINQKELHDVCQQVRNKIYKIKQAVTLFQSMLSSVRLFQDFVSCCKALLAMQTSIGETVQLVQNCSLVSSRVEGVEMGLWRVRLPFMAATTTRTGINFGFATWKKKKELDSLLQELEQVFEQCVFLQNSLIHLEPGFSSTPMQLQNEVNPIDLPNQSKWSCEIMRKEAVSSLTMAKEWNQDSLIILRNLIEWDYQHRFSVGESNDDDEMMSTFDDETTGYYDSSESHFLSGSSHVPHKGKYTSINSKNSRIRRFLLFSIFFVSFILVCMMVAS